MGTRRKINAILLNIKINQLKLVDICVYELATNQQNFNEKHLAWVKISQKVLGGLLFLTHTVVVSLGIHLELYSALNRDSPFESENLTNTAR